MSDTNPQIEEQLNKLSCIICQSLEGEHPAINDETEALLKSLLMSGYARKDSASLRATIESRVKDKCRDPAMHRGGALSGITKQLQEKFDELVRWESRQNDGQNAPKAANISAATDS